MTKLGILAGSGRLPVAVADSAMASGRTVHIIGISGEADTGIESHSHSWIKWGEIGRLLATLKDEGCGDLVIIGGVKRPDLSNVKLDFGAVRNLPLIMSLTVGGDDSVLGNVVKFFESKGLKIFGAHEVAPDLLAGEGALGHVSPSKQDRGDIAKGARVVRALGALDVGQSAVVTRDYVLAVEAAEGTDAMLERCKSLRQWGAKSGHRRAGVLIKCPKPRQEMRIDMPAIGPRTLQGAADAGLAGVAIAAGGVLIAGKAELVANAEALGMFVYGIKIDEDEGPEA